MVGLERGTVTLSPYRSEWKQCYGEEVERLEGIAGDRLHEYEHIGSTAVEGLAAKPIIASELLTGVVLAGIGAALGIVMAIYAYGGNITETYQTIREEPASGTAD